MGTRYYGYACQNLSENISCSSTIRMANFSIERVNEICLKNATNLLRLMEWNGLNGVHFFRITSDLLPFSDHPILKYTLEDLYSGQQIKDILAQVGKICQKYNIRIEMHPGPYTVLSSPKDSVVEKSIASLESHYNIISCVFRDSRWVDSPSINWHIGGVYGDLRESAKRFCQVFSSLPQHIKDISAIENDDKNSMFSVKQSYELVYQNTGVRITYDHHHHGFHPDGLTPQEAAELAFSTWNGVPITHYSEPRDEKTPRAHSEYIKLKPPVLSENPYDVMIEAKGKDLAWLNAREKGLL